LEIPGQSAAKPLPPRKITHAPHGGQGGGGKIQLLGKVSLNRGLVLLLAGQISKQPCKPEKIISFFDLLSGQEYSSPSEGRS
jgi:hypothetical protein